ncbi:MAG: Hpt domain-containing protein [Pseudomonadota bacterium]|nr:Hpt domain-containing protein [Pseudomonadota bacterium]
MSDKPIDPASIQWIRDEIEKNAEQAILALEGYFEHNDQEFLQTAKDSLHQIYGTLQIVELYPPSTLAQELEKTLDYLMSAGVELSDEYISKVIQCISLIVRYIDGVLRHDDALTAQELIPPLNILRAIRNEPAVDSVSDSRKYFEDQSFNNVDNRKNIQALSVKLLKLFQFSYLKFAEGEEQDTNLSYMTQSLERFSRLFPQKNLSPLWGVIIGACQSLLINQQYKTAPSLNEFFGKLMHLLKIFASSKSTEVESRILTNLFIQGLEILSALDDINESSQMMLEHHKDKLEQAPSPSSSILDKKSVNAATLGALGDALVEEISYIKDALDIFSRSKETESTDLQGLLNKLKQLSDSMALIQQLEIPRQSLEQQILRLDKIITTSKPPSEDWLIDLATSLLFVESSAMSIKQTSQKQGYTETQNAEDILIDARKALLREILIDLAKVKSLFVECVSAAWDIDSIKNIKQILNQVEFRLLYIDENQAMALLEKINEYITYDLLLRSSAPEWHDIEEFADIIAALDQYLYLRINTKTQTTKLLDQASVRLSTLYSITDEQRASQIEDDNIQPSEEIEKPAMFHVEHSEEKLSPSAEAALAYEESDDADDEIREIFREELEEIEQELKPLMQNLAQNPSDIQILSSLRRLVHTVKGSGRMAQLPLISEPALALENLLNDLIEKNHYPGIQLLHHITDFVEQMRALAETANDDTKSASSRFISIFEQQLHDSGKPLASEPEYMSDESSADPIDIDQAEVAESSTDPELFTDMQRQEINSHYLVIHHYYKTNHEFIEQAPQDESLLRAMHTLKAIFRCSENEGLGEAFIWFEEMIRLIMKREQHRQPLFFKGLDVCCQLVSAILEQEADLDPLTQELEIINAKLKEFVETEAPEESPYEAWLEDNSNIFDYLMKSTWLKQEQDQFILDLKKFTTAADAAQKHGLTELSELLHCFIQYVGLFRQLPADTMSSYEDDVMSLQDKILGLGDQIALGQTSVNPEPVVEFAYSLLDRLKDHLHEIEEAKQAALAREAELQAQVVKPEVIELDAPVEEIEVEEIDESPEAQAEILGIFKDETRDILDSIDAQLKKLSEQQSSLTHLRELQRDYHTMKGGANFISEEFLAALACEADLICERFLDAHQLLTPHGVSILTLTQNLFRDRLNKLPNIEPLSDIEEQVIRDLKATLPIAYVPEEAEETPYELPEVKEVEPLLDEEEIHLEVEQGADQVLETEPESALEPETFSGLLDQIKVPRLSHDALRAYLEANDHEIVEIFIEEAYELLDDLDGITQGIKNGGQFDEPIEEIHLQSLRIAHTLKGGSRLAGLGAIGDAAQVLEKHIEHIPKDSIVNVGPELEVFAADTRQFIDDVNQWLTQGEPADTTDDHHQVVEPNTDPTEDDDIIKVVATPNRPIADFVEEETSPSALQDEDPINFDVGEQPAEESDTDSVEAAIRLQSELNSSPEPTEESVALTVAEVRPESEMIAIKDDEVASSEKKETLQSEHNPNALSPETSSDDSLDDYDQEILEIFYEESKELVEELEKCIGSIEDDSIDESRMDLLKRILHTIKGSARLAGFAAFGNQAHLFESHLETLKTPTSTEETRKVIALNDDLFRSLQDILERIQNHLTPDEPTSQLPQESMSQPAEVQQFKKARDAQKQAKRRKNTEVVRIGAELLERLENLAGETVIARSSVEQELLGFNRIFYDFGTTLDRIHDNIRSFENETENRMISASYIRQMQLHGGQGSDEGQDFDTLEMDRFSSFHQLARSLSEAASDLIDMRDTMMDKVRTTEGLVMQQSRVQKELHEGLMLSRMVPFSRLAPRLTRMVRQVAEELGKQAELEIINAEGQMDRSVLERMIPPLEHMLRNALDHGIEMPDIRQQQGKPVVGKITLHLFREGNEIVLRLSDDGAGIDVNKVKEKAINNGLLAPDSPLSEKEILQFIFKPGFSTASKVTQISGRGVGMDVVFSEIKQLNGSLKLHAAPQVGTQFTIRLPFTVSMSRALMVRVGDETYAIPLTYIEGVVRVSPYELSAIYDSERNTFSYAGKEYEVNYLGDYLQSKRADSQVTGSVPLLLARSTERAIAIQVDTLVGSKEIIMKNPGSQLSQVVGLSGATIMGDGSVVLILDLNALIRDDMANTRKKSITYDNDGNQSTDASTNPMIMVVDDSVTVRKVTSRLLERHGMDVLTAKDGIDAVTQLRDKKPDLILLDIEMPRMDGFEVASHIRHDPRLLDTPIIMISSRTGEKHRQRAEALGVNAFLGKPYQEVDLIDHINDYLSIKK